MSSKTTNYNLHKIDLADSPPDITVLNQNFDTIDSTLKAHDDHVKSTSNPHGVTKAQVGLGNVPNVSTNDQTPTYTAASSNTALTSGEKLSVAMGKIAKAVSSLISHLSSTSNPHSVTKSQVGLENVPNVATNDQTPTYSDTSTLATLASGEKLSVAMAKIKLAITNLISHLSNTSNPHSVTASQLGAAPTAHATSATTYGAGTGSNYGHVKLSDSTSTTSGASAGVAATPTAVKAAYDLANTASTAASTAGTNLSSHTGSTSNPHSVTATQVGLGNVPNVATNDQTPTYTVASSNTALSSGEKLSVAMGKIAKAVSSLISHLASTSNPHSVTASQVGLGSVNNTSDANKPVSTAQATAIADAKAAGTSAQTNLNSHTGNKSNPHGVTAAQVGALPIAGGTLTDKTLALYNGIARVIAGSKTIQLTAHEVADNFDNHTTLFLSQAQTLDKKIRLLTRISSTDTYYKLYGEHNKPSGSYDGNGSGTKRTMNISTVGSVLLLRSAKGVTLVTPEGALRMDSSYSWTSSSSISFVNGVLTVYTTNNLFNGSGVTYYYEVV